MVVILALLFVGISFSEVLYIAAAASLRPALTEIVDEFEGINQEVKIKVTFGSSGSLYSKISAGAPYHLFLSADTFYPRRLLQEGLALEESYFEYAEGRIVLFYTAGEFKDARDLLRASKVALPNPRYAPYGRAALQFLKASGLYETLKDRLVYGSDVSQTVHFVISGGAEVGIVSLSLVKHLGSGRYTLVPENTYDPVVHAMVITIRGKDLKHSWKFLEFMKGPRAKEILRKHGFGVR